MYERSRHNNNHTISIMEKSNTQDVTASNQSETSEVAFSGTLDQASTSSNAMDTITNPLSIEPTTAPSASIAEDQLDSDDDDTTRRSNRNFHHAEPAAIMKQKAQLRRERAELYTIQEAKRRRREETHRSKAHSNGETPLFQKVKRLRGERRAIEKDYECTGGSMKKKKNKKKKKSAGFNLPKNDS